MNFNINIFLILPIYISLVFFTLKNKQKKNLHEYSQVDVSHIHNNFIWQHYVIHDCVCAKNSIKK